MPVPKELVYTKSSRNVKWVENEINAFTEYIKPFLQMYAKGREVWSSTGEQVYIPHTEKIVNADTLVNGFREARTKELLVKGSPVSYGRRKHVKRANGQLHYTVKLRRINKTVSAKRLHRFIKTLCPATLKNLKAVDSMAYRDGTVNYCNIRKAMEHMLLMLPDDEGMKSHRNAVLESVQFCEEFSKCRERGLHSIYHFKDNPLASVGPACHCSYYLFGERDEIVPDLQANPLYPCGHNHRGICVDCERLHQLPDLIDTAYKYYADVLALEQKTEEVSIH